MCARVETILFLPEFGLRARPAAAYATTPAAGPCWPERLAVRHHVGGVPGARLDASRPFRCNNRPAGLVPRRMRPALHNLQPGNEELRPPGGAGKRSMQPDMAQMAWHALTLIMEPARLGILIVGVLIGLAIGVLPGLNGIVGIAMLIPFTYNMDQYTAMALLLGM